MLDCLRNRVGKGHQGWYFVALCLYTNNRADVCLSGRNNMLRPFTDVVAETIGADIEGDANFENVHISSGWTTYLLHYQQTYMVMCKRALFH